MADLKQAFIWLAEGKRIRQKHWTQGYFRVMINGLIRDSDGDTEHLYFRQDDDWELYKESEDKDDLVCQELIDLNLYVRKLENEINNLKDNSSCYIALINGINARLNSLEFELNK